MDNHSDHCLLSRIDEVRSAIDDNQKRVDNLERKLRLSSMSDEKREDFLQELRSIQKEISNQEKILQDLHRQNRKTFSVVALIATFAILLFLLYSMTR